MKLTSYTRVSTNEQVEHGKGLDIQRKAVAEWARLNGHEIAYSFSDEGISGTKEVEDRPGLEDALASVKYNGSDGLVVTSLDRLARTLTIQEGALAAIWQAGGTVFTVDAGEVPEDDPNDPVRTFVRQIMGAVGQLEAGMIRRRLHKGRMAKAEDGGYIGGVVRYGYNAENGKLVPDPMEQRVIGIILEQRAKGHGYPFIAKHLNALGIASKNGGEWYPSSVRNVVLANETKTEVTQ